MSADFSLSQDSEFFIQQQIAVGTFRDRSDAIEAGVELLRQRQALLDRLDESTRQLQNGDYLEFDEESLRQFFERLTYRATKGTEV